MTIPAWSTSLLDLPYKYHICGHWRVTKLKLYFFYISFNTFCIVKPPLMESQSERVVPCDEGKI
jgi:hypothetical protein